jgi:hypothetical protein
MPEAAPGAGATEPSRYEAILRRHAGGGCSLAASFHRAAATVASTVPAATEEQSAIRDVAAGAAGPAFCAFVTWIAHQARNLDRLAFLSRDGQILYELARRIDTPALERLDLRYVYSSRRTWNLAGSDPDNLAAERWLYGSFMHANATDICHRLGLNPDDFTSEFDHAGVSLDPDARADDPAQHQALAAFVANPHVVAAVRPRIARFATDVACYAVQEHLCDTRTGLVDVGWTGKMLAGLYRVLRQKGLALPHSFFFGYEQQVSPTLVPNLAAWLYDSRDPATMACHVHEAPYVIETFSMADHGLVTGYERTPAGYQATLATPDNPAATSFGIDYYRKCLYRFAEDFEAPPGGLNDDARTLVHDLVTEFWTRPTVPEARAWGTYVWDSDPTATAARPLASPFTPDDLRSANGSQPLPRGDRAWLAGSLALTPAPANDHAEA